MLMAVGNVPGSAAEAPEHERVGETRLLNGGRRASGQCKAKAFALRLERGGNMVYWLILIVYGISTGGFTVKTSHACR